MKKKNLFFTGLGLVFSMLVLQSCFDDDDEPEYDIVFANALVTVKPNADNSQFTLQLTDDIELQPVNMKSSPFGTKEVRALVNYREPTAAEKSGATGDMPCVYVNWLDSIRTKTLAPNFDAEQNYEKYGKDAVEIIDDWVTIAEDGYLTLRFRTLWGNGTSHSVNLVHRSDAEDPYTLTFYHNAYGDTYGQAGDALVAFKLDGLPDTQGQTVDLTLEWFSFSGTKTAKFKYCTREATNPQAAAITTFNASAQTIR